MENISVPPVKVEVYLDKKTFCDFAWYDTFAVKKRWKSPLIFFIIMCVFGTVALTQAASVPDARVLGFVLFGVGVLFPVVYVLSFWLSLKDQCAKLRLDRPRHAYTLTFSQEQGLGVTKDEQSASIPWSGLHRYITREDCTYIYVTPANAYIIPHSRIQGGVDVLEDFLCLIGR